MSRADQLVDEAADRLQKFANEAAAEGGLIAKLAEPLADDAAFVRQLKPSLIKARFKGEAPLEGSPSHGVVTPSNPAAGKGSSGGGGGPNPFVVMGAAFVVGIVIAKVIDWRGHAHPRD
jgi:hypothetical protein